jgi:hypothetical protein
VCLAILRLIQRTSVQEIDAYLNFLIPAKNSLFLVIFSLLICVGNFPRSGCGTGVFRSEMASESVEIAKFPVNFPVSRELPAETGSYLTAHTTNPFKYLAPFELRNDWSRLLLNTASTQCAEFTRFDKQWPLG